MTLLKLNLNIWFYFMAAVIGTVAVIYDLRYRRIPNWLTFGSMLVGVILNIAINPNQWYWPLAGLLTGLGLFFIPFALGGIGAGDLKLLMALGTCIGPYAVIWVTLLGGIYGGIISLLAIFKRLGANAWLRVYLVFTAIWNSDSRRLLKESLLVTPKIYIPYGLAIYLGLLSLLFFIPWF